MNDAGWLQVWSASTGRYLVAFGINKRTSMTMRRWFYDASLAWQHSDLRLIIRVVLRYRRWHERVRIATRLWDFELIIDESRRHKCVVGRSWGSHCSLSLFYFEPHKNRSAFVNHGRNVLQIFPMLHFKHYGRNKLDMYIIYILWSYDWSLFW
jgi:hypothetical protein